MLTDLLRYRRYILQNALRDIRHRYAGTGLGLFWHVIAPFLQILMYWVVFTQIMPTDAGKGNAHFSFAVYLCAGLLPWVSFSEAITRGTGAFLENAAYLKRLPIPGHIFVATAALTATLQLAISLVILIIFALALGLPPAWTWLLLPVICLMLQALGFGLGLILGTLNIFFRDVAQFLIVFLQIWMWSVPIVYLESFIPHWIEPWLRLNPPYAFFVAIHAVFLDGTVPPPWTWLAMGGWICFFVLSGLAMFGGLQSEVRDVL